jgi:hypothetical protein
MNAQSGPSTNRGVGRKVVSHATSLSRHTYESCAGTDVASVVTAVLTRSTATSQRTRDKLRAMADARGMSVSKLSRNVLDEFVKSETLE